MTDGTRSSGRRNFGGQEGLEEEEARKRIVVKEVSGVDHSRDLNSSNLF